MRIGIFTESYEPIINGVSVCVDILQDELVRRGHEVYVFAPGYKGHKDTSNRVFRFPSTHTIIMPDYPFPVPYSPGIRKRFAELKLDVVHTQTPFLLGLVGARWAKQQGIPLVSTNHTLYTEYVHYVPVRPKAITRGFLVGLMKWYYSGCDAVAVPSTPVEKMLKSYGITTPTQVIKSGIVPIPPITPDKRAQVRERLGVGDNELMLLYAGRIAREKNLRMLLTAFKTVLGSHPGTRLAMVGGGPALAETKQFADTLGLTDRITFTGMLRRHEIEPVYASADAFAFASKTETQGLVICEAMSAGLPVVAVNAGGIPENIRHGIDGFLTEDDPDEFATRISYLIENPEARLAMASEAQANSANFSTEATAARFEALYQAVIDARKTAAPPVVR